MQLPYLESMVKWLIYHVDLKPIRALELQYHSLIIKCGLLKSTSQLHL